VNEPSDGRVWPSPSAHSGPPSTTRIAFTASIDGSDYPIVTGNGLLKELSSAAIREEDFDTAMVWAGEAVDLIVAVEGAARLVRQISAEAQERLGIGAGFIRGDASQGRRGNVSTAARI